MISKPLFNRIAGATIKNLELNVNCLIDEGDNEYSFGVIANAYHPWSDAKDVLIDNCAISGNIDIKCRNGYFGTYIGSTSLSGKITIQNSYSEADISVNTRQGGNLGGIAGNSVTISNCFNSGSVSLYATCTNTFSVEYIDANVGGILGYNYDNNLYHCYNTGKISVATAKECRATAGGIVGYNYSGGTIFEHCQNSGTITTDCEEDYDCCDCGCCGDDDADLEGDLFVEEEVATEAAEADEATEA